MKMLRKAILIFVGCIIALPLIAEIKVAKYGGEFLSTGVGARALGMGGAFVAAAEDVTSIYWNPAGLASLDCPQIHGMHAERFAGIVNWDFVGGGMQLRNNLAVGFGFFRLGVDGIPFTALRDPAHDLGEIYIDDDGREVQNDVYASHMFDNSEMAFVFSVAQKRSSRLSYGANIKVIRKSAGEDGAWGLGFDVGVKFNPYRSLNLGAVLMDGTSTLVAWNGARKEVILPHLRVGAAYPFEWSKFQILPVFDIHVLFENRGTASQVSLGRADFDFRTGIEIAYLDRIALRVGVDRQRVTAGAGLKISAFIVDYGFMPHPDLGDTHRISVTFSWDKNRLASL
jgi:hypothetical protein